MASQAVQDQVPLNTQYIKYNMNRMNNINRMNNHLTKYKQASDNIHMTCFSYYRPYWLINLPKMYCNILLVAILCKMQKYCKLL